MQHKFTFARVTLAVEEFSGKEGFVLYRQLTKLLFWNQWSYGINSMLLGPVRRESGGSAKRMGRGLAI